MIQILKMSNSVFYQTNFKQNNSMFFLVISLLIYSIVVNLKLVSAVFYQILQTMKNVFYFI